MPLRRALVALLALVLAACSSACSSSGGGRTMQKGLGDSPKVGPYAGFGLVPPRPRPDGTLPAFSLQGPIPIEATRGNVWREWPPKDTSEPR